jgi:phosphonate transport system substrate-binding protein
MQGERYGSAAVYFSDVVVRSDSAIERFEQLEGETWAYNEPRSHSGFNVVCYALARQGRTLGFFGKLVEAGAHQSALRKILSGEAAAAAIDSTVLECELERFPQIAGSIRVIDTLGPSPSPPWIISKRVAPRLRASLRACLAGMSADREGRTILGRWNIAALRPIADAGYDAIREMARVAAPVRESRRQNRGQTTFSVT